MHRIFGVIVVGAAVVFATTMALASEPSPQISRVDVKPCEISPAQPDFAYYTAGTEIDGLPLTSERRLCDEAAAPDGGHRNFVLATYGTCEPSSDQGCAPPLSIETWPACERYRDVYRVGPENAPMPRKDVVIRGVPAAWFEDGERLELYTGQSTVVIFSRDQSTILAAADRLQRGEMSKGAAVGAGKSLPAPLDGSLSGSLECAAHEQA